MKICDDLRQAVLQAAIQGKLTTQRKEDGDARELLKQIAVEKAQLIKEKKIKKEKPLPEITEEEIPFEVPENWVWCRLEGFTVLVTDYVANGSFATLKKNTKTYSEKNFAVFVRTIDLSNNFKNNLVYIDEASYNFLEKSKLFGGELIIPNIGGSIGKVFTMPNLNSPMSLAPNSIVVKCINATSDHYLKYIFLSSYGYSEIMKNKGGTATPKFSKTELRNVWLPIPPLAEQHRIVAKVEKLMAEIDELEKVENELHELKTAFPGDMKAALLQAAMQGKLTTQRKEDGDARDLLKQIAKEKAQLIKEKKIKKEKPLPEITEDEIPFDVPENWVWVRISNATFFQEGPGILAKDFRTEGVPLIRIAGMQTHNVSLEGCNYLDPSMVGKKWEHFRLDLGDIIISTSASLDKIAEVGNEAVGAIPYTGLIRFKMLGGIDKSYFKMFIMSPCYINQIANQEAGGTIKHYGPSHLRKMFIPLPPLAEQQRIVAKLEKLLPLCDGLVEE